MVVEANLQRKIDAAYALMQRLDGNEPLSKVLPQFKTLAGFEEDLVTQALADMLIYGLLEIPDAKPPLNKPEQQKAGLLYIELCSTVNPGDMSVDSVLESAWTERIPKHDKVIHISVFAMERMNDSPTPQPPLSNQLIDQNLRIHIAYEEAQKTLFRLRSYASDYASKSWQQNLEEMDRIQLLGPDYRLVLNSLGALNSEVGNEPTTALDTLSSDNPASWGLSALGCRTVAIRLGKSLWNAKGDHYQSELLKKPLVLTGNAEKNKLSAYIDVHWCVANDGNKPLLEEAHKLVLIIHDVGSKGKIGVGSLVPRLRT